MRSDEIFFYRFVVKREKKIHIVFRRKKKSRSIYRLFRFQLNYKHLYPYDMPVVQVLDIMRVYTNRLRTEQTLNSFKRRLKLGDPSSKW